MKLRAKFAIAALVLVEVVLATGIATQQVLERRHLEKKLQENQSDTIAQLASVARDTVVSNRDIILLNYLKVLTRDPVLLYAALLDTENKVRLHSDVLKGDAQILGSFWKGPKGESSEGTYVQDVFSKGKSISDWSLAVYVGKRKVGTVHIGYDALLLEGSLKEDLLESLHRFLIVAGFLSVLGLAGALLLAYRLNRPIQDLQVAVGRLAAGQLKHQIKVRTKDELGELSHSFNEMARQLAELNQLREDLLASITHDLKAPILAIRGYAELLLERKRDSDDEEVRESLQIIHDSSKKLSSMTEEILDFATPGSARMRVEKKLVDLGEVIRSVVQMLKVMAQNIQVNLEAELPKEVLWVPADPEGLRRVLGNLIYNGLKFTPAHGLVVIGFEVQGDSVCVKVADTGVGIPTNKLSTVFTRYMQVDETQDAVRRDMGTGLGLAICKEIVTAHGGKIWAESKLGKGTTVLFTLPLTPSASLARTSKPSPSSTRSPSSAPSRA